MKKNFPKSEFILKEDDANKMSMFFANPSPMIKLLTDYIHNNTFTDKPQVVRDGFEDLLATLANMCHDMVETETFESIDVNYFCLRIMTVCIVIYDTVCLTGAFTKKSKIRVCFSLLLL